MTQPLLHVMGKTAAIAGCWSELPHLPGLSVAPLAAHLILHEHVVGVTVHVADAAAQLRQAGPGVALQLIEHLRGRHDAERAHTVAGKPERCCISKRLPSVSSASCKPHMTIAALEGVCRQCSIPVRRRLPTMLKGCYWPIILSMLDGSSAEN